MGEFTTAARPYAKAVFELAQVSDRFESWSEMLSFMAAVAHDSTMRAVLDSPSLTNKQAVDIFTSVCKEQLDQQGENFVKLLAENRRLTILPDIAALFAFYRSEAEGKLEAEVVSAKKLKEKELTAITVALEKRLGRNVVVTARTDPALLGGAIIRAGDLVIDGSIRGKLDKLAAAVSR
jgi:F-type H+-transporting ATPase subunit delta